MKISVVLLYFLGRQVKLVTILQILWKTLSWILTKLIKTFLTVALGDFDAKSQTWFKNDKTSYEGSKLDALTFSHGLHQLINEPTHFLDSFSSCIDLIFTSQSNLSMEPGVQPSLYPNCHYQLVFTKFDLSIYYPPPYERTVWYYNRANANLIRRAMDLLDWDKALRFNDVDKQVAIFSDTLMNIMQNLIPNETIICDDRDPHG